MSSCFNVLQNNCIIYIAYPTDNPKKNKKKTNIVHI